jgi:hypothetical protein
MEESDGYLIDVMLEEHRKTKEFQPRFDPSNS